MNDDLESKMNRLVAIIENTTSPDDMTPETAIEFLNDLSSRIEGMLEGLQSYIINRDEE